MAALQRLKVQLRASTDQEVVDRLGEILKVDVSVEGIRE